jgi:UDP-glucose 4-epimerase
MAILVTGGAGYIGSHMVLALNDRHDDVVVLDNLSTGTIDRLPENVPLIKGDIGDTALLDELFSHHKIDSVIHFAAKIVVPESVTDPLGYYDNNTARALRLFQAAVRHKVKHVIFSSTAAVYGDSGVDLVDESTPQQPMSPYGMSKLMVEWMLRDITAAHDLSAIVLRYFNVAGADPQGRSGQSGPNSTHLIKVAVETALGMRPAMAVYGTDYPTHDGTCIRDYVHVSDLIGAHLNALDHLRNGGKGFSVYNCAYGRGASVLEVIDSVKRVSGVDFTVTFEGRRAGDPASIVANGNAIREQLGWQPQHDDLDEIVRHALAWERKRSNLRPLSLGDLPLGE